MSNPSTNVIRLPGASELPRNAPKSIRSIMDTLLITQDGVRLWKMPPFQRPLRVNAKVMALAEVLKANGGVLPGVLTIGVLGREKYLLDGQHRIEAFKLSEVPEGYVDVRLCTFDSVAEMGEEFVNENSKLVTLRPDDILRGLEGVRPGLSRLRELCPFVGYDQIRRGSATSALVGMSQALRVWEGSGKESPSSTGTTAQQIANTFQPEHAEKLAAFLNVCRDAWGSDPEYARLWSSLNLSICAWMWRNMVTGQYSPRSSRLTVADFHKGMLALSAAGSYLEWLVGRQLSERDRSPCYNRVKLLIQDRIEATQHKKLTFPSPPWSVSGGSKETTKRMVDRMRANKLG